MDLATNPAALARDIQALPVIENGKFVGVRLAGGRDAALLARFGCSPNASSPRSTASSSTTRRAASEVAESLKNAQSATVVVRRNGQAHHLSVSLR
jgi:type II secretory pathway component PulC